MSETMIGTRRNGIKPRGGIWVLIYTFPMDRSNTNNNWLLLGSIFHFFVDGFAKSDNGELLMELRLRAWRSRPISPLASSCWLFVARVTRNHSASLTPIQAYGPSWSCLVPRATKGFWGLGFGGNAASASYTLFAFTTSHLRLVTVILAPLLISMVDTQCFVSPCKPSPTAGLSLVLRSWV